MKIAIIGWYGTETIGDRAILAGLIKMFYEISDSIEIYLGSIYPFFTEKTLYEDESFLHKITGKENIRIKIFDSRDHRTLTKTIKLVDSLVVGGGPLLDVSWMYMIEYAMMKAKKLNRKTALLGCGLGPLTKKTYFKSTKNIISSSDYCIFRDTASLEWAEELVPSKKSNMYALIDPAVITANAFNMIKKRQVSDYIAVNLREFPMEYAIDGTSNKIQEIYDSLKDILMELKTFQMPIKLIPMHYFAVGGDDRVYLNKLSQEIGDDAFIVQNDPLTLEETLECYANAKYAIGMRFHSVVLQTMCNGNNYILDYTHPQKGKIGGFINQIGGDKFYHNRYVNLQTNLTNKIIYNGDIFAYSPDKIIEYENKYKRIVERLV